MLRRQGSWSRSRHGNFPNGNRHSGRARRGGCRHGRRALPTRRISSKPSLSRRPRRPPRRRPCGSTCISGSSRVGMSIGATPAIPGCRPRSTGTCRRGFRPATSSGRCPSTLCKTTSAITAMPERPTFSFRSPSLRKSPRVIPLALAADASWLACAEICIPGGAELSLNLPVTAAPAAPDPAAAALFAAVRRPSCRFRPRSRPGSLRARTSTAFWFQQALLQGSTTRPRRFSHTTVRCSITLPSPGSATSADGLEIALKKAASAPPTTPETLDGVLVLRGKDGVEHAFEIAANPALVPPADNGGSSGGRRCCSPFSAASFSTPCPASSRSCP